MSVIAKILKLETFGSYIRRYLLGMLPEQLPLENMIEHVYVVTEIRLNAIVIGTVLFGCLIRMSLTFLLLGKKQRSNQITSSPKGGDDQC